MTFFETNFILSSSQNKIISALKIREVIKIILFNLAQGKFSEAKSASIGL